MSQYTIALLIDKDLVRGNAGFPRVAIQAFMQYTKAERLAGRIVPTEVRIGDTDETLADKANVFCIQVSSDSKDVAAYLKTRFLPLSAAGISLVERAANGSFVLLGKIQPDGEFTPERVFAPVCKDLAGTTNWASPETIPPPIRFQCPSCGRTVSAPPRAAGKKGKCPTCKQSVSIPKPALADKSVRDPRKCPSCQGVLPAAAVICVECGFDIRSNKKLVTIKPPPASLPYSQDCFDPDFVEQKEICPWSQLPGAKELVRASNSQGWGEVQRLAASLIQSHAEHHFGFYWLGQARRGLGQLKQARECLLEGMDRAHSKYSLCLKLGEVEWDLGDLEEAVRWWIKSAVLQFRAHDLKEHAPFLYLSYVAEGCGQDDVCSALRHQVDHIQSGQIRLDAVTARRLIHDSKKNRSQDVRDVLTRLNREFLKKAEQATEAAIADFPADQIPKCANCDCSHRGSRMRFVCRHGEFYVFRCDGCGLDRNMTRE